MTADFVQVATATQTRDAAVELAQSAVRARLAAGAQIVGPVVSVFWHHGEFGSGEEWQLLLKTRADRYTDLEAHLRAHHPWNNPEIVAVPILAGSAPYLDWIRQTTEPEQAS
ncbi:divalent-cation tolerance protein CutA [Protofrankia symbiont of Coriaria ruscifolia]|uniref:divalent-cation tolerance protein CutA n=1 Tax=Protofrankia symbiont of Coriaria ruscifolia TaxID=1306542 RepID=UPI0010412E02|nr:divalent-cation tolerance protein CutA [Protofrankia symbiont of Coriaria ruscifolia]